MTFLLRARSLELRSGLVWGVLVLASVASVASLDEGDPVNFAVGTPGTAVLDPTSGFTPIHFRGTASHPSGTLRLSVELDLHPASEGGSSSSGQVPSLAIVEGTLSVLSPGGTGPSVTLDRALGSSAGDPPLELTIEAPCRALDDDHCIADFELDVQRVDEAPTGSIAVTWTPTATLVSSLTADVTVTEIP